MLSAKYYAYGSGVLQLTIGLYKGKLLLHPYKVEIDFFFKNKNQIK